MFNILLLNYTLIISKDLLTILKIPYVTKKTE